MAVRSFKTSDNQIFQSQQGWPSLKAYLENILLYGVKS